jgi:uncharacterized protein YbjT (DUF2867 family)
MILLTGATGTSGSEIARLLAARKVKFRAFVRDPKKAQDLAALGAELADGTFEKPGTLEAAARGCDTALILPPGEERLPALACAAIAVAKRAGVKRIVYFSAIGAGVEGAGGFFSSAHGAAEACLAASGLPHTILQPDFFMTNWLSAATSVKAQSVVANCYGRGKAAFVDPRDIAEVAAAALTDPAHDGRTYVLTGPEALSGDDVAAAIGRAVGRTVRYVDVPRDKFQAELAGYGLPRWQAEAIVALARLIDSGLAGTVTDDVRRVTGHAPRTFDAWCRDHADAFR